MTTESPQFIIPSQAETSIRLSDGVDIIISQFDDDVEAGIQAIHISGRANVDQLIAALQELRGQMA